MQYQLTTLVLGEVSKSMRGNIFQMKALRSAPHYFETSVPHQVLLGEETIAIEGRDITFSIKGYPPDILLIETATDVSDIFSEKVFDLEEHIFEHCDKILNAHGGSKKYSETYSVFSVARYQGEPEQFMKHAPIIASLLKSERVELDPKEIEYTLSTQIKYAKNDLAIIDWDGAFLFDAEGDFKQTIELLTLANVQLLRHRIVDRKLDERLEHIAELIKKPLPKKGLFKAEEFADDVRGILKDRMATITQFQILERDIKLIGDWYPARFYELATRKFKIAEWRLSVREKLESIERIYGSFLENFSVSAKGRIEHMQIVAEWFLIGGWLSLIILEVIYFVK